MRKVLIAILCLVIFLAGFYDPEIYLSVITSIVVIPIAGFLFYIVGYGSSMTYKLFLRVIRDVSDAVRGK